MNLGDHSKESCGMWHSTQMMSTAILATAVLSCLVGYVVLSQVLSSQESLTLRLVIILFRHGQRTPASTYKSDPYKNYDWPNGHGSLTNVGKLQMYELGKKYRRHYASFIPEEYDDRDVYVRSSDKVRCLMSAYTFLAGLYPPSAKQVWHPQIPWQPIPVHALPRNMDNIVAATKKCHFADSMYSTMLKTENSKFENVELFKYLQNHTSESDKMNSILHVDFLYSTLATQQEAGLTLPEWTKEVFPEKMKEPFMMSLALRSYNTTLQRYNTGPLLVDIRNNLESRMASERRSLYVYSAHDVNVVSLYRALGFDELLAPEYGASIAIELYEKVQNGTWFIKLFYRNDTEVEHPVELKPPYCKDSCSYESFMEHLDTILPSNRSLSGWEMDCKNV